MVPCWCAGPCRLPDIMVHPSKWCSVISLESVEHYFCIPDRRNRTIRRSGSLANESMPITTLYSCAVKHSTTRYLPRSGSQARQVRHGSADNPRKSSWWPAARPTAVARVECGGRRFGASGRSPDTMPHSVSDHAAWEVSFRMLIVGGPLWRVLVSLGRLMASR
jgi:hypothetical protein